MPSNRYDPVNLTYSLYHVLYSLYSRYPSKQERDREKLYNWLGTNIPNRKSFP